MSASSDRTAGLYRRFPNTDSELISSFYAQVVEASMQRSEPERSFFIECVCDLCLETDLSNPDFDEICGREQALLVNLYESEIQATSTEHVHSASTAFCSSCQKTTSYYTYLKQTRSIDEPMTRFRVCMACGKNIKCNI